MYREIRQNIFKTYLLIIVFVSMVIGVGMALSAYYNSPIILYIAVAIAFVQTWIGYYYSDKIALAVSGAKGPISKQDNPLLYNTVENLAITSGLPMPKVYIIPTDAMNAFATGRDPKHAAVAATRGLLDKLNKAELEGVMAHELAHVKNYDIRVMSIVVVLVGVLAIVSDIFLRSLIWGGSDRRSSGGPLIVLAIVGIVLAPLAAKLIQLAVSRSREYLADASGALITRYPDALASALRKISADHTPMAKASQATAHMFIANPFRGKQVSKLFATHPPVEDRIKRLQRMISKPS